VTNTPSVWTCISH